jgi:hypothetical protein
MNIQDKREVDIVEMNADEISAVAGGCYPVIDPVTHLPVEPKPGQPLN